MAMKGWRDQHHVEHRVQPVQQPSPRLELPCARSGDPGRSGECIIEPIGI
jgi:hypothetical protein